MNESVKLIGVAAPFFLLFCLFYIDGGLIWTLFLAAMFFIGLVMGHSALPEWMSGWPFYGWLVLNVIGLIGCLIDAWPWNKDGE